MGERIKVALVDDHRLFRNGFSLLLAQYNAEIRPPGLQFDVVISVDNGKELRRFLEGMLPGEAPDLVITDINNPVTDGFDTAK